LRLWLALVAVLAVVSAAGMVAMWRGRPAARPFVAADAVDGLVDTRGELIREDTKSLLANLEEMGGETTPTGPLQLVAVLPVPDGALRVYAYRAGSTVCVHWAVPDRLGPQQGCLDSEFVRSTTFIPRTEDGAVAALVDESITRVRMSFDDGSVTVVRTLPVPEIPEIRFLAERVPRHREVVTFSLIDVRGEIQAEHRNDGVMHGGAANGLVVEVGFRPASLGFCPVSEVSTVVPLA